MAKGKFKAKGVYAPVVGFSESDYSNSLSLDGEQWKTIPMFDGAYEASNYGRVRSKDRISYFTLNGVSIPRHFKSRILRCVRTTDGYLRISISHGKVHKVLILHRIIALTWFGESKLQIDHINGNKQDNRICNLEYVTNIENIHRAIRNGLFDVKRIGKNNTKNLKEYSKPKFNKKQIEEIRRLYSPHRFTRKMLAAKYNCGETVIRDVIKRRNAYKDK